MTGQSGQVRDRITTAFDAACVDVIRRRMHRPLIAMPGQQLLPRFAQHYQHVLTLPRRARRSLQRQWKRTLGGVALLLALTSGAAFAATMNVVEGVAPDVKVDGECSLIEAIVNANNDAKTQPDCPAGSGTDTINLPAKSKQTLRRAFGAWTDPGTTNRYQIALPQIKSPIIIQSHSSTIERADNSPITLIATILGGGNLTLNETHISGQPSTVVDPYYYGEAVAGCIVNNGTLSLTSSSLRLCASYETGVAALRNGGTATLRKSTVSQNFSFGPYGSAGAIENDGILTLSNSSVTNNRGARINNRGTTTIDATVISGNETGNYDDGRGGGIYNDTTATLTLSDSVVTGNAANQDANAVLNLGTANITKTLTDGLYSAGTLTVTNSTISGGHPAGWDERCAVTFGGNATIIGNYGYYGVCVYGGTLRIHRSVIAGNKTYDWSSSSYIQGELTVIGGTVVANDYNIFGYSGKSGVTGFTPGATDIVPSQPLSGILMPAANNGGIGTTFALAIDSPALNAAPVDALCTATDQRGNPRPQGVKRHGQSLRRHRNRFVQRRRQH